MKANFSFSEDVLRLNPALAGGRAVTYRAKTDRMPTVSDGFDSQLERDYNLELRTRPGWRVQAHGWTFHLPGGVDYTPDFIVWDGCRNWSATVYEVKGAHVKNTRESRAKFKIAAGLYPWLTFVWVTRTEAGRWIETVYRVPVETKR